MQPALSGRGLTEPAGIQLLAQWAQCLDTLTEPPAGALVQVESASAPGSTSSALPTQAVHPGEGALMGLPDAASISASLTFKLRPQGVAKLCGRRLSAHKGPWLSSAVTSFPFALASSVLIQVETVHACQEEPRFPDNHLASLALCQSAWSCTFSMVDTQWLQVLQQSWTSHALDVQNAELDEAQALGGDMAGSAQNQTLLKRCCEAPEEMVSSDEVVSLLNMIISTEIEPVYPEGGCVCRELAI